MASTFNMMFRRVLDMRPSQVLSSRKSVGRNEHRRKGIYGQVVECGAKQSGRVKKRTCGLKG